MIPTRSSLVRVAATAMLLITLAIPPANAVETQTPGQTCVGAAGRNLVCVSP